MPALIVFATPKMLLHLAAFRKDSDCGAMSGLLFVTSTLLVYVPVFVLPAVVPYVVTYGLVLGPNSSFARLAALACASLSVTTTGMLMLLFSGGVTHFLGLSTGQAQGLISAVSIGFWSFFGVMSSFYISEPTTPIYMRWLYYISPQFYYFSSSCRIIMEGLPLGCNSKLLANIAQCALLSPIGFLRDRSYDRVDIARHVGMQMVLWIFYLLAFWALIAVVDWWRVGRRIRDGLKLCGTAVHTTTLRLLRRQPDFVQVGPQPESTPTASRRNTTGHNVAASLPSVDPAMTHPEVTPIPSDSEPGQVDTMIMQPKAWSESEAATSPRRDLNDIKAQHSPMFHDEEALFETLV